MFSNCCSACWEVLPLCHYVGSVMLRQFFGPEEVRQKLEKANFCTDNWFTGGDCASAAIAQLQGAVQKRTFGLKYVLQVSSVCC